MPHDVICPIDGPFWSQLTLDEELALLETESEFIIFSLGGGEPEVASNPKNYRTHF